ncbi:zinc finger protein, putative [Plasmodium gallinaceum]|uniref:Zinc finger protein, putative n=1 Tax=Plasmodium gallinaceum TaxID=5849 RepID=A0A1J1GQP8_PLAGA|nr:zinc finger protein, putative [Plasmodium gallinaceum]CRG94839.1 zinc finger protein, putative [Plasmodium gallinaceum]
MEKINDKQILEKISTITGGLTNTSVIKKKSKKKKKKRKNAKLDEKKKSITKNRKRKIVDLFEDYKLQQKKETCKFFFKKGKCIHNENCSYSHDVIPIYKISKLCKFLVKGTCDKKNCIFSHDYQLFYCRNNVIFNSCNNPFCKFKHIKIGNTINNADEYNLEVDNVLSKDDKIRFLYNNKNYLMELLIHKYHNFDNYEEINVDELIKKDNYPWFINGIIDLIKLDFKYNKADVFFKLVKNYMNKTNNLKCYIDKDNLKILQNDKNHNELSKKNTILENINSENNNESKEELNTFEKNNKDNKTNTNDTNNTTENFNDYKFYSSEEEDYTQYLNKYFEIDT